MVSVDPLELAAIAERIYVTQIQAEIGSAGVATLQRLLPVIRQTHMAISTERVKCGLDIVCFVDGDAPCLSTPYAELSNVSRLTSYFDGQSALTVQLLDSGIRVWTEPFETSVASEFVGYHYTGPHVETIFTRRTSYALPKISASPSYFGIPYFRELRDLLERYGVSWIRQSMCEIFRQAWLDDNRVVFGPRPEFLMRRSLQRHLRSALREHSSVMPEQNVNETRPVDIKVTWAGLNRVALIEIKWLGKSARPGAATPTQNFTDSRAQEGAQQLATYLDLYHKESPDEESRGYLVVYDARRRNVKLPAGDLSSEDATYYRNREISYDAEILARSDFEQPVRFFCEPA